MRALLARLGDPQASLRGVLVGGTNGKGSTAAMVAAVLQEAGFHTCQAPSPHLSSYRERILVDGLPITRGDLEAVLDEVLRASEPGEPRHGPATQFELLIAAAFLWSASRSLDVAVIEVGLGGRLDATNAWDAQVAAITDVGLDHQAYLGDTVESVAVEKSAIIKPGSIAVTGSHGRARDVIAEHARAIGVPLTMTRMLPVERHDLSGLTLRHERLGRLHLSLLGRHQAHNAGVALGVLAALESAGVASVDDAAIVRGFSRVRWPGRLEPLVREGVTILLDGAHNPDGAAALAAAVEELAPSLPAGRATLLMGVLADKALEPMLARLRRSRPLSDAHLIASSVPDTDRSLPAAQVARAWLAARGPGSTAPAEAVDSPDEALERALRVAGEEGGPLVVAGSLYLVGHVRARLLPGETP